MPIHLFSIALPHNFKARTIGKSSLMVIFFDCHFTGHPAHAHSFPKINPKPISLSSVNKCISSKLSHLLSEITDFPLKDTMNFNHANRSSLASLVTYRLWCGYLRPLVKSIMRLKKTRPGGTTQQAKFNKPISD